jgi:hypothetical protein
MKVKEIQATVGTVVTPRSQFEPDRLTLAVTVATTTDDERDVGRLQHYCRKLTKELAHAARTLTGVELFARKKRN